MTPRRQLDPDEQEQVASAMETTAAVLPYLDELLVDSTELGCSIILEDGFKPAGFTDAVAPGYEHYRAHAEAVAELMAHGDRIEAEVIVPTEEVMADDEESITRLRARAAVLAAKYPDAADLIRGFAEDQVFWSAASEAMVSALWLLRRSDR